MIIILKNTGAPTGLRSRVARVTAVSSRPGFTFLFADMEIYTIGACMLLSEIAMLFHKAVKYVRRSKT